MSFITRFLFMNDLKAGYIFAGCENKRIKLVRNVFFMLRNPTKQKIMSLNAFLPRFKNYMNRLWAYKNDS